MHRAWPLSLVNVHTIHRWNDFTASVAHRAAESAQKRQSVMLRREQAQQEGMLEKRRALEQRITEANERRLAHIHMLMQQARVASERSAQAQQFREANRRATRLYFGLLQCSVLTWAVCFLAGTTWADESAYSTTDGGTTTEKRSVRSDNESSNAESGRPNRRKGKHGKHGKHHQRSNSGCSESGCSMSGDESARSDAGARRISGDTNDLRSENDFEKYYDLDHEDGEEQSSAAAPAADVDVRSATSVQEPEVVAVPPTLAALEAAERLGSSKDGSAQ